jgi:hypothetical protein
VPASGTVVRLIAVLSGCAGHCTAGALGLDEHREAGRFLVALDTLLADAGIPDAAVIHHMGHVTERSRGDSRIRDWPEWRLVREDDEPSSPGTSPRTAGTSRSPRQCSGTTDRPVACGPPCRSLRPRPTIRFVAPGPLTAMDDPIASPRRSRLDR